MIALLQIYC